MSSIAIVYGTRPEAIKLAPLVKELRTGGGPHEIICTGQHSTLLQACPLPYDAHFELMEPDQTPAEFVARALVTLTDYWQSARPSRVVVQGDTATAFAATLAAFHLAVPVAHVEAGLRSGDMRAPFPEEGYRILIDHMADRHYAATEQNAANLLREGIAAEQILITGNTGVDAALAAAKRAGLNLAQTHAPYVLVTLHRREAFGEPMRQVCRAIKQLAQDMDLVFFVTLHPNPNAGVLLKQELGAAGNVFLIDPLPYDDLIATLRGAWAVLTDSGGIQEEAPAFGIPVLVARQTTERREAIDVGAAELVGYDTAAIVAAVQRLRRDPALYGQMAQVRAIFGDGLAAERIGADLRS